jgi:hypothetical protein
MSRGRLGLTSPASLQAPLDSGLGTRWVMPAIALTFLAGYVAIGQLWVTRTQALTVYDVLFEADCPRVVTNSTALDRRQERTILHPLYVLITTPLGAPLAALVGSRELAAVIVTAVFAAGALLMLARLLASCTALGLVDRVLFVLLAGFSAGHLTFGSVPETHVVSAFMLSLAACHVASCGAPLRPTGRGVSGWTRLFVGTGMPQALLAAGAVVTSVLLAPVLALLHLDKAVGVRRRVTTALLLSGSMVALLAVLTVAQRALLHHVGETGPREALALESLQAGPAISADERASSPVAYARAGSGVGRSKADAGIAWLRQRFDRELSFVTWSPWRVLEVTEALLLTNLYVPRVQVLQDPGQRSPSVRLQGLDMRSMGVVGAVAWLTTLGFACSSLRKRQARELLRKPALVFTACWLLLHLAIYCVYYAYPFTGSGRNDVFLFAPSLVLPLILVVGALWGEAVRARSGWLHGVARGVLLLAVLGAAINSGKHLGDLFDIFRLTG